MQFGWILVSRKSIQIKTLENQIWASKIHPNRNTWKPDLSVLKICLFQILSRQWCMFCLDMDMSESGMRQAWILSQIQNCSRPDSDLEHSWVRSADIWVRSEWIWPMYVPGLNQALIRSELVTESIPASVLIGTCLSERNLHHFLTRSEICNFLKCSDLVCNFLLGAGDLFNYTFLSIKVV